MSLFGTTIELNMADVAQPKALDERLTCHILKKHKERDVFLDFLRSSLTTGTTVFELMHQKAKEADGSNISDTEAIDFVLSEMKLQQNGLPSPYKTLVDSQIAVMNPTMETAQKLLVKGKLNPKQMPKGYPVLHKRAEGIVLEKIKESIGNKDKRSVAQRKELLSQMRTMARDLFYAVNLGLEEKEVVFLKIMFYLDTNQTTDPLSRDMLREMIFKGLNGETVELIHIKSLRFTYPGGKNLKMLDTLDSVEQEGLPKERRFYPSEKVVFIRLRDLQEYLNKQGVKTKLTVIVSDHDLEYCFPEGQNMVPQEDLKNAKRSIKKYIKNLKQFSKGKAETFSLTEFLREKNIIDCFESTFSNIVDEGKKGKGVYISEKMLVARADEQFEHYLQMFGNYSHDLARFTSLRQIANAFALSEVFLAFPSRPLLVIDNRGFENKLIGGYKPDCVAKYFTRLKDPVKITTTAG